MHLLQYSFTLAPAHDMQAVRERVAARRHLIDGLPGLRWKAWLLAQPLPGRHQPKTYAPLYLFDGTHSVIDFLCGDIYRGVTDAFGWTSPLLGPAIGAGPGAPDGARSCTLHTVRLHDHAALRAMTDPAAVPPLDAMLVVRQLDVSRMLLRCYTFRAVDPRDVDDPLAELVYEVVAVTLPAPR